MLFNSYIFVFLFFPLAVAGYYELHHFGWEKAALGFLIVMSMIFYGYNSVEYLLILITSIVLNYLLVQMMGRTGSSGYRRMLLVLGLLLNLGILFCFKYYEMKQHILEISTIFSKKKSV